MIMTNTYVKCSQTLRETCPLTSQNSKRPFNEDYELPIEIIMIIMIIMIMIMIMIRRRRHDKNKVF